MMVSQKLIEKYNIPVPRYTSYPPANHFYNHFTSHDYLSLIEQSNSNEPNHIAFYIHIPFCTKICYYCGCNACAISKTSKVDEYISALKTEIQKILPLIDKNRKVSQIHFGGGTPNAIGANYLAEINAIFFNAFDFIEKAEIAIECNPAYLDFKYIDGLIEAGFNRFSLGIQDFNLDVLKGVNRQPSSLPVEEFVSYLKSKNSAISVNLDFIYGLPGQTVESFSQTIAKAAKIRPNRLVTFSYAHVPWMKKHQQILEKKGLPSPDEKMEMFLASRKVMLSEGYAAIGLDHYVLPTDELNVALNNGMLHRNFQGYCTRRTTGQVYAFGVSSISQLGRGFSQNIKEVDEYISVIEKGELAVEKGYALSDSQIIVKEVIEELMCNGKLDFEAFTQKHKISIETLYSVTNFSWDKLSDFIVDGLVIRADNILIVTELGALFMRNIAAAFDPEYKQQINKYSNPV